ncbi:MAG: NifB/NifX family molybdenum-iron cluster-binding protein [Halobacteriota archaeon]|nr:NifB/NifX family molybdenum-iron cluster-binding protein [Halobacteriota archaeon]
MFLDSDTMDFSSLPNEYKTDEHDVGIIASERLIEKGIEMLITGNVGPNALSILSSSGIEIITGAMGTVSYAIKMYKKGKLISISDKNAQNVNGKRN